MGYIIPILLSDMKLPYGYTINQTSHHLDHLGSSWIPWIRRLAGAARRAATAAVGIGSHSTASHTARPGVLRCHRGWGGSHVDRRSQAVAA